MTACINTSALLFGADEAIRPSDLDATLCRDIAELAHRDDDQPQDWNYFTQATIPVMKEGALPPRNVRQALEHWQALAPDDATCKLRRADVEWFAKNYAAALRFARDAEKSTERKSIIKAARKIAEDAEAAMQSLFAKTTDTDAKAKSTDSAQPVADDADDAGR